MAVAFVTQIRDAFDGLLLHQLRDALDHARLVDLVRHLGDDDRFAILADLFDLGLAAHHDRAAAQRVSRMDSGAAKNDAAGREIRARHDLHQFFDGDLAIVDIGNARIDHFAEIVRRDIGRHADGDAGAAVDENVRKACRYHFRFLAAAIEIRLKVDGLFIDVLEQRIGGAREARFRVTHRRRRIAVHRAEIALALDQRQAHGKILRHAHQRFVDRRIAMGMEITHHLADAGCGFAERAVPIVTGLLHREENAAMNRFQTVAHIG